MNISAFPPGWILNQRSWSDFATRQQGERKFAESIRVLFEMSCRKYGLSQEGFQLETRHFLRDAGAQRSLF